MLHISLSVTLESAKKVRQIPLKNVPVNPFYECDPPEELARWVFRALSTCPLWKVSEFSLISGAFYYA
jgi:hypothetical protein